MIPSAKTPEGVAWIIYRISGTGVELMAPLAPGAPVRRRDHPGGVRVYACGNRDVRGLLDSTRASQLRRAYGLAC